MFLLGAFIRCKMAIYGMRCQPNFGHYSVIKLYVKSKIVYYKINSLINSNCFIVFFHGSEHGKALSSKTAKFRCVY